VNSEIPQHNKNIFGYPLEKNAAILASISAPTPHRECPFYWTVKSKVRSQHYDPADSWKREMEKVPMKG